MSDESEHVKPTSNNSCTALFNYIRKRYTPSRENVKEFLLSLFNCVNWIPKYNFKAYFLKDLLAGLTLGIVLIPQTMGFSLNGV